MLSRFLAVGATVGLFALSLATFGAEPTAADGGGTATLPCQIKSLTGTRDHERRQSTYDISATDIVYGNDGSSFTGKLAYRRGYDLHSEEPFTGRVGEDGSIRLESRFVSRHANHDVKIVGTMDSERRFSGREGNYGTVKATVECRDSQP